MTLFDHSFLLGGVWVIIENFVWISPFSSYSKCAGNLNSMSLFVSIKGNNFLNVLFQDMHKGG